ncbi:MAG: type II toxin-antitoxin system HicB family antitoxin [Burkholderiales bacterium]
MSMRYMVVIEKGPTSYGAFVPDLPGCIAAGETEAEAVALIQEAIQLHLEDLRLGGKPIPEPVSKSTFVEIGLAA